MTTPRQLPAQGRPLDPDIARIVMALAKAAARRDHEAEIRREGEPSTYDNSRHLRPL